MRVRKIGKRDGRVIDWVVFAFAAIWTQMETRMDGESPSYWLWNSIIMVRDVAPFDYI